MPAVGDAASPKKEMSGQDGEGCGIRKNERRIRYDPEADVLNFILRDEPPVDAVKERGGVIISYGEDGDPVSVEFLHVSAKRLVQKGELSITLRADSLRA
jgi:uncharacterized protein YuzE